MSGALTPANRRLENRDFGRFSQDGTARRGFLRQMERLRSAEVRECVRKWNAGTRAPETR